MDAAREAVQRRKTKVLGLVATLLAPFGGLALYGAAWVTSAVMMTLGGADSTLTRLTFTIAERPLLQVLVATPMVAVCAVGWGFRAAREYGVARGFFIGALVVTVLGLLLGGAQVALILGLR